MAKRNALEVLLELIDTEMARALLDDLRDDERRTPQLYNAVSKFLDRHNFKLSSLMIEEGDLGELQAALDAFRDMELEDLNGVPH
ncbi:terminase small subunit [Pseudomonas phage vB_PpuP-Roomu-1]